MHAAIHEAGAVYASARVHDGWFHPVNGRIVPHPPSPQGGHAFAIVGYDAEGFWVQNSWGPGWGDGGIALWEYADWARGITDGWVLRIGVPTPGAFEVRAFAIHAARDGTTDDTAPGRDRRAFRPTSTTDGSTTAGATIPTLRMCIRVPRGKPEDLSEASSTRTAG